MFHRMLRLAYILHALFALLVIAIGLAPYDESQLHALMTAPEFCGGSCVMGIRPPATKVQDALSLLETHPWVTDLDLNASGRGFGQIRWRWSGRQPAYLDERDRGRITFVWYSDNPLAPTLRDAPVETISIQTSVRMYALQTWYRTPYSGTANFRLDGGLGYSAAYRVANGTLVLSTILYCPVNLLTYWNAPTRILMSSDQGTSAYVAPFDMVQMC